MSLRHVARPLRLCIVTAYPPQRKGEAEYAKNYVAALRRIARHRILVNVLAQKFRNSSGDSVQSDEGVRFVFDPESAIDRNIAFLKILSEVAKMRPHVVHVIYGPNTDYGGRIGEPLLLLLLCLRIIHIPVIVSLHSTWLPADVELRALELRHSDLLAKLVVAYFKLFVKMLTNLVEKVLLVTTLENSFITRSYVLEYGLRQEKIGEEPHGCQYAPISEYELETVKRRKGLQGKRVILSLGFIRRDKGFEYLIDAFPRVKGDDNILVIAGSPKTEDDLEYLNYLRKLSRSLGVSEKVLFDTRYLPENELWDYIDAADVVVYPYLRSVGPSGPLHYAMSRGKPSVATRIGFMSVMNEIILLVSQRNSDELAHVLDRILNDQEFAASVRTRELQYAKTHDWSRVVSKNLRLYLSLRDGTEP